MHNFYIRLISNDFCVSYKSVGAIDTCLLAVNVVLKEYLVIRDFMILIKHKM